MQIIRRGKLKSRELAMLSARRSSSRRLRRKRTTRPRWRWTNLTEILTIRCLAAFLTSLQNVVTES